MAVTLIIPCYWVDKDLVAMTGECVYSAGRVDETLIIDDGSPIEVEMPGKIIRQEKNGGYSKAVNAGLEAAIGDILVVANNDLTFPENWLAQLLWPLDMGFDIATCWLSDQSPDLEDRISSGDKFSALFAMHRGVYDVLGGLDEQFRGYFSDTDYRRRALNVGLKIGMNRSLVVGHQSKATYRRIDPQDNEYLEASRLYEIKHGFLE